MNVKNIEAIAAVVKLAMSKPGTIKLTAHNKTTFIKNAVTPNVTIVSGKNMICNTGLMKVLTTPMITAVTIMSQPLSKLKPGVMYDTTARLKEFSTSL
jgi:hypothetical protein